MGINSCKLSDFWLSAKLFVSMRLVGINRKVLINIMYKN